MPVDAVDFKRALGQFATGITVITTRDAGGKPLGLTVNAFCSLSLSPPLVLVCIDNRSETNAGFRESSVFGVSVLAEGQEELSRRFAVAGAAKFDGAAVDVGESGVLLLADALAQLECQVVASHVAGDHTIYVGRVERVAVRPGRALVYHARGYRRLEPEAERAE